MKPLWKRIFIRDACGNVISRLISDLSELDAYRNTQSKIAISPANFDGNGQKASNVIALSGAAIDLDACTANGFLTREQAKIILNRIPAPFANHARVVHANGVTLWLDFIVPCSVSLWPQIVKGLVRLALNITDGLDWVMFDRGTLVKMDGSPAKRENAVFRYHPSYADRRLSPTEQLSKGGPIDANLLIQYGDRYQIPAQATPVPAKLRSTANGRAGGSLQSQQAFISAVAYYLQTNCDRQSLAARFGLSLVEADKIVNYRATMDRKLARKVLHHHRTTLPLLPKAKITGLKAFTRAQRYAQKSFDALAFLGWFYFYLREAGLTVDQGWRRLLYDDNLVALKRVVVRHWTVDHFKADHAVWLALFGDQEGLPLVSVKLIDAAQLALKRDPTLSVRRLARVLGTSVSHSQRIKRAWRAGTLASSRK